MCLKQYPPAHHRDAEHLREELQDIHNLLRVCVDSLELADIPEIEHTVKVLDKLADRTYEATKPAKELETVLFGKWTAEVEDLKAKERAKQPQQPVVKAFKKPTAANPGQAQEVAV